MRLVDADALAEEIKSLYISVTGLRAGRGILSACMKNYKETVLRVIDEQPTAFDKEAVVAELEEWSFETEIVIPGSDGYDDTATRKIICTKNAIEIVNQLAEEYKDKSSIIDGLRAFLKEKFDYCAEQAGMNLEAECNSEIASYFRDRKELYLDRANIYGEVMREIDRLAEEHNNGWIPYTTGCEMPNEASRVWLSFTTPIASFVKSAWYINGHFEWDNCKRVKETPMAWKPYNAPAPYQPKGE